MRPCERRSGQREPQCGFRFPIGCPSPLFARVLINDRPAKILILGEASVTHAQRWAQWFADRAWTTRWLSFAPISSGQPAESLGAVTGHRAWRVLRTVSKVRRIIDQFRPDIVSALFIPDYGWLAAMAGSHPVSVSAWGSDVLISPRKSPLHRWRISYVLKRADRVFADAEFLRGKLLDLDAKPDAISLIPLGVDDEWLDIAKPRPREPRPPVTVVINRRQEPLYRVETLVQSASLLSPEEQSRFRFVLIGEGSQSERLRELTHRLGVGALFECRPWLAAEQLREALSKADLYVSTSSSDGTSVSLLEAMAAGCYPVVTDIPGNREWIVDGDNGLFFEVGNADMLAERLRRAAAQPDLRERAAARNREIITRRARWIDNMTAVENAMIETIQACNSV